MAELPPVARAAPHHQRPSHTSRKVTHLAWPLAAIGAMSLAAGNPFAPQPTAPSVTAPPAAVAPAAVTTPEVNANAAQSPGSYVAPDGRTFAQLVAAHVLPDPLDHPGVVNPDITPDNMATTVCRSGWTATVRPPVAYTDAIKKKSVPPGHTAQEFELDHLMSIEDGGDPKDERNLWMQTYNDVYGARVKDVLETKLKRMVCAHQLTLDQARAALSPNWLIGFQKYVGPLPEAEQ